MNNREVGEKLGELTREERRITHEILELINLARERRAYLEHGFSSLFDWLVKGFGYSHSAAYRRIEAAKVLKSVPETARKLQSGEVNLTTLSKVQTAIRNQEKSTGHKVALDTKREIINKIKNKSARETEQILCAALPEFASSTTQERRTVINEKSTRHSLNFSIQMSEDLRRAKELLSHKFPNPSDADIVAFALKFLLDKSDPLRKTKVGQPSAAASKSVIRRSLIQASQGGCSFKDPMTGRTCGSRHQVQIDHILPKALGGTDDPENLRPLCRQHNLHMAEVTFGKTHMAQFRNAER